MSEWIVASSMCLGAVFMLLAAIGVVRFPDVFMRMHAATKAGTLGKAFIVLAVMVHFAELGVVTRAALIIVFFFLTAPVAAHMIGKAAHASGVPLWDKTTIDELREDGEQAGGSG